MKSQPFSLPAFAISAYRQVTCRQCGGKHDDAEVTAAGVRMSKTKIPCLAIEVRCANCREYSLHIFTGRHLDRQNWPSQIAAWNKEKPPGDGYLGIPKIRGDSTRHRRRKANAEPSFLAASVNIINVMDVIAGFDNASQESNVIFTIVHECTIQPWAIPLNEGRFVVTKMLKALSDSGDRFADRLLNMGFKENDDGSYAWPEDV